MTACKPFGLMVIVVNEYFYFLCSNYDCYCAAHCHWSDNYNDHNELYMHYCYIYLEQKDK